MYFDLTLLFEQVLLSIFVLIEFVRQELSLG